MKINIDETEIEEGMEGFVLKERSKRARRENHQPSSRAGNKKDSGTAVQAAREAILGFDRLTKIIVGTMIEARQFKRSV